AISIAEFEPFAYTIIKKGIKSSPRYVNNALVSDHHAIIPTEEYVELNKLSYDERRIYDLVIKRFLAVLSEASTYESTKITASIDAHHFYASGKIMKEAGWRALYQKNDVFDEEENEESSQTLPNIVVK
ncbi:MAG: DNA topoisomerase, partial [Longicatena sp.]